MKVGGPDQSATSLIGRQVSATKSMVDEAMRTLRCTTHKGQDIIGILPISRFNRDASKVLRSHSLRMRRLGKQFAESGNSEAVLLLISNKHSLNSAAPIALLHFWSKLQNERWGRERASMLILVADCSIERRKAQECFKSHSKPELAAAVLCGEK